MGIKLKDKDTLVDESGNTAHISYRGSREEVEEAEERLRSLSNCTDCSDCFRCDDCSEEEILVVLSVYLGLLIAGGR